MRRISLAVCAIAFAAAPLHAQASMGVIGGFVSSNISTSGSDNPFNTSSRSGFAVGVSIAGMLGPNVSLGPEAMYVQKGTEESGSLGTATLKLDYVEVPLLLKLMAGNGETRFFVLGGPDVAFKVSCSFSASSGGVSDNSDCSSGTDNDIKSTDFGIMAGVGVGIGQISVSGRYDFGLTNVNNGGGNPSYKNHALLILGGVHF